MKQNLLLFSLLITLVGCKAQNPDLSTLSPEQWREDIRFFMEQAPKTHLNLYNTLSKSRFDSIGADLMNRVPKLTADQITAEMVRWVAALGDGHTNLTPSNTHVYPVLPFWFKEGFFVINAQKEGKAWLGWKLLKINNEAVETIAEKLRPYQQRDGEQQIKSQAPGFLVNVEALRAVGVVSAIGPANFTFKNTQTGDIKTVDLQPIETADLFRVRHGGGGQETASAWPLYRQHRDKMYWFEWIPATKTLYFQYNEVHENPHESIQDFIHKMAVAVDENPVERFVVDIRWNGGGNLFTSKPFTEFISNHPKINQRGKLFVILGRNTFSAASFFTSSLEFRTQAIFVGESTGATPNHYGDTRPIRLPNSGLIPQLSSIYWQNSFPWDKRPATQPDIPVEPTFADWQANRDAALEAILQYKTEAVSRLEIPASLKQSVMGRYLYEGEKVVDIREQQGQLHLSIPDFIETDLLLVQAGERLASNIRSLFISPAGGNRIKLEAVGGSTLLEKLPANFKLPLEMIVSGQITEGLTAYRELKKKKPTAQSTRENELNRIGYELMNAQNLDAARAIFELNTEFYPQGFNTWDSLAEFYMNSGDKTKAIAYYKKSLELNPNNANGKRMLEKLE